LTVSALPTHELSRRKFGGWHHVCRIGAVEHGCDQRFEEAREGQVGSIDMNRQVRTQIRQQRRYGMRCLETGDKAGAVGVRSNQQF